MMRRRGLMQALGRCRSGAAAVEFAIIAWAMIFVCLGLIEFGRGFHARNELSYAADFAARKILTDPLIANSELEAAVREVFAGGAPAALELDFGEESEGDVAFRTIALSYPFSLLIPSLAQNEINLTLNRRVPLS